MHSELLNTMALSSFWKEHKLLWVEETKSTNDDLKAMWHKPDFFHCLEVADCQTNGKGQYERKWISASAGQCLMFSFSAQVKEYYFPISMIAGAALALALDRIGLDKKEFWLKWPNDIWVGNCKLVGILTESMCDLDGFRCVIGIGLNMRPVEIEGNNRAVSLQEKGITLERERVLCEFCKAWDEVFALSTEKQAALWNEYGGKFWERNFIFDVPGKEKFLAKPLSLDADGTLLVESSKGQERIIAASLSLA